MKEKNFSFKYSMFWFGFALFWWLLGQVIIHKPIDVFLIASFSLSTFVIAPLAYFMVNKNFERISTVKFFTRVIPLYIVGMIIVGVIFYLLGFIK